MGQKNAVRLILTREEVWGGGGGGGGGVGRARDEPEECRRRTGIPI